MSYTWREPGKLGILLHSKTVHPVGAVVKSTSNTEVAEALLTAGVKIGMMLTKVDGTSVVDMHYSDVMMKLKSSPRPLTVHFNDVHVVDQLWYQMLEASYEQRESGRG